MIPPPIPDREAARLRLEPLEVTPGLVASAAVELTNDRAEPCTFALTVAGLEADWVHVEPLVGPVGPGQTVVVPLEVRVPVGYPPATLVGTLSAAVAGGAGPATNGSSATNCSSATNGSATNGAATNGAATNGSSATNGSATNGSAAGPPARPVTTDIRVTVGDGALIMAHLEPQELHGAHGGHLDVVLHNRGHDAQRVELTAVTPNPAVEVRFSHGDAVLHPGAQVRVRTRVRASRPVGGGTHRRPFGVRVQGRSTPVLLEGTLVQRPLFAPWLMKTVALVAVAALWIAVAVAGITALSHHVHKTAAAKAVAEAPPITTPRSPSAGSSSRSSGHVSTPSPLTAGFAKAGAPGTDRVGGKVSGPPSPGGVAVTIQPTSLASQATQGATVVEADDVTHVAHDPPLADGMVWGTAVEPSADAALIAEHTSSAMLSTTTAPDGLWAFAGLRVPATYLVTFSKAGYNTAKYVVTTTTGGETVTLDATLAAGTGSISGRVVGPSGPLGDVSVMVTDGPVTVTTRTPSVGSGTGDWSIGGLSTPGDYLITASLANYGTQTTEVDLAAGGSASGVRLYMTPGVGTITGRVTSVDSGAGVAGLTVAASNATTSLSTTTTSSTPVGSYTLPNLPIPGTYDLTVSGEGYVTQTRKVHLTGNLVVDTAVTPSQADVIGSISAEKGGKLRGLGGAGVTLTNAGATFKTLTSTSPPGDFNFGSVPPGEYTLSVSEYGYASASADVTVNPGQTEYEHLTVDYVGVASEDTATIDGSTVDLFNATPLAGATVYLDGRKVATSGPQGTFVIDDVGPGIHELKAEASGFEDATEQVDVLLGGLIVAAPLELPRLDTLSGTVVSGAGGPITDATVTLTPTVSGESTPGAVSTGSSGGYTIRDLIHGTYTIRVSAGGYAPQSGVAVTLTLDSDLTASPISLTQYPDFFFTTISTGGTQVGDVCALLTGPGLSSASPPTALSASSGSASFLSPLEARAGPVASPKWPLVAGDTYKVSFFELPSTPSTWSASDCLQPDADAGEIATATTTFTARDNVDSVTAVNLVQVSAPLAITLKFGFAVPTSVSSSGIVECPLETTPGGDEADCPGVPASELPTVTVSGAGGSSSVTATAPVAGDAWTVSSAQLTSLALTGVNPTVDVTISGGDFGTATLSAKLQQSATSSTEPLSEQLTPDPVAVSGSLRIDNVTGSTTYPSLDVTVDPAQVGTASVVVTNSGSTLTWTDSSLGSGEAEPGVYDLTASAAGYVSDSGKGTTTATADIGVCSGEMLCSTAATVTLDLEQEETLDVSVPVSGASVYLAYLPAGSTDTSALDLVSSDNGGTITATQEGSSGAVGTATTAGYVSPVSSSADEVQFTYLSPVETGTYELVVSAPGYQTWFDPLTFSPGVQTVTPSLTQEGEITGTVYGSLFDATSPLAGVTVTATPGACASAGTLHDGFTDIVPGSSLTTTTASDGSYSLTSDSTITVGAGGQLAGSVNGGLCDTSYSVSASATSDYSTTADSTVTVTVATGALVQTADLTLQANTVSQSIEIEPVQGDFPTGTVFSVSYSATSPGTDSGQGVDETCTSTTTPLPSDCTATPTSGPGGTIASETFTFDDLYPTTYTFTVSATDFTTVALNDVSLASGTPELVEQLTPDLFEVTGTVTTTGSGGSSPAVPGLLMDLDEAGTTTTVATTSSNSSGAYTFTGVAAGTYDVEPDPSTDYTAVNADQVATGTSLVVTEDVTVSAEEPEVDVTVTSTAGTSDLTDYTAELTEVTPAPDSLPYTCSSQSGAEPLLVAGLGPSTSPAYSASVTGSGGSFSADLGQVVPDFYELNLVSTVGSDPTQTATAPFAICPGTTAVTESFEVQQGEVSGTVVVDLPPGFDTSTAPTVMLTVGSATPTTLTLGTPSISNTSPAGWACGTSTPCDTATYSYGPVIVPLGEQDSVSVSETGYTSAGAESGTPTASSPTLSLTSTLEPTLEPATITVDDSAGAGNPVSGATVTIANEALSSSITLPSTGADGTATTSPSELLLPVALSDEYTATATYTQSGTEIATGQVSFVVGLGGGTTPQSPTVTLAMEPVTVNATAGSGTFSSVSLAFCTDSASCGTPTLTSDATLGTPPKTASFTGYVPTTVGYVDASATFADGDAGVGNAIIPAGGGSVDITITDPGP